MPSKILASFSIVILILIFMLPNVYGSSSAQITVFGSGRADVVITFTAQEFDREYEDYQLLGETLYKATFVIGALLVGWIIVVNSMTIDVDQSSKVLTMNFPLANFAEETSPNNWRILLTSMKTYYPTWSQTGNSFSFNLDVQTGSTMPLTSTVIFPVNASNVQFDSNDYVITYYYEAPPVSKAEIKVDQNGNANFALTYVEDAYSVVYSMYQYGGEQHEAIFKGDTVTWGLTFGWIIDVSSIIVDIDESTQSMTVSFVAQNFAEELSPTNWRLNISSIKNIYPMQSKSGQIYNFNSVSKPVLPLPETTKLYLPQDAINDQFDSNSYFLTYQLATFTVNFDTVPDNMGTITFEGENFGDDTSSTKSVGTYSITSNPASGYTFTGWEIEGALSVADLSSVSTTCTVSGDGTLRMIQSFVCTIVFETVPSNTGSITFDGVEYGNGSIVTKNAGTYNIIANPIGYGFGGWEIIGGISVSNLNSGSTTCTISANGTIRMIQAGSPTPTATNPPPQSGCVIVTASHGSETASEVVFMRHVRDDMLGSNEFGRTLVAGWNTFYYSWSPIVAGSISNSETLQTGAKIALLPLVGIVHLSAFLYTIIAPVSTTWASIIGFSIGLLLGITTYFVMPVLLVSLVYKKRYLNKC